MNSIPVMLGILALRRGPQDLPADPATLVFWVGVALVAGMAIGIPIYGVGPALTLNLVDLAVLFVFVRTVLAIRGLSGRWVQTYAAMMGVGAILGVAMALLMQLGGARPADPESVPMAVMLGSLILLVWLLTSFGYILQQAMGFATRLPGVLLGLGFVVLSSMMTQFAIQVLQ
ncbi:MAG: hypothetical protein ACQETK_05465 [Pseudomonadota bacterium]